jgi:hypothetical protein
MRTNSIERRVFDNSVLSCGSTIPENELLHTIRLMFQGQSICCCTRLVMNAHSCECTLALDSQSRDLLFGSRLMSAVTQFSGPLV